jgi:hypothetical protein
MGGPKIYMVKHTMKCQNLKNSIFHSLKLVAFGMGALSLIYTGSASAFFGIGDPKIEILVPNKIEEGGIIPINVRADNFEDDPIKSISLTLEGNPTDQQKAFILNLEKPQPMIFISTRVRLSASGVSPIRVQITQLSGKSLTKTFQSGYVYKPVDFTNPDTLSVTYQGGHIFPKDNIGQPLTRVGKKNGDSSELEIRGILHHPMLPGGKNGSGFFVNSVEFFYENDKIGEFETGSALSNDPYLQLNIKDDRSVGTVKMVWKDVRGNVFESTK